MKIVFAGIVARYPFGGVTWCSLMYLLGLRALGHDERFLRNWQFYLGICAAAFAVGRTDVVQVELAHA